MAFKDTWSMYLVLTSYVLLLVHPVVSTYMIQIFDCQFIQFRHDHGHYWLQESLREICFTGHWWLFASVSIFVLITFVLGLPVVLGVVTWTLRQNKVVMINGQKQYVWSSQLKKGDDGRWFLRNPKFGTLREVHPVISPLTGRPRTKMERSFLASVVEIYTASFKREYYWFASVDILRKFMQTGGAMLCKLAVSDGHAMVFVLIITMAALTAQGHCHPYADNANNVLQIFVFFNQCTTYVLCLERKYVDTGGSRGDMVGMVMIAMQLVLLLCTFMIILQVLRRRANTMFSNMAQVLHLRNAKDVHITINK
ncbi:hypothetical protein CYMTET_15853 [Cymbomonas tetramitiformis]|uniref:Uncharacterized protein n=1 Tax=Cymbomonas tetramitiformis TaxID=36881 RepID=A0AAE0GDI7_9CHLO|nr:hypothetical protein CYMTET_15853 [Cymbomonas tetramitiformis]